MSVIPQVTCRRCQRQYSSLRGRCPHCGTKKTTQAERPVADTASARAGTASSARAASNARWQLIFGVILLVGVIASVITLISMSLSGEGRSAEATPPISAAPTTASPTFTPEPSTPTPPPVTSISFAYRGTALTEFRAYVDTPTPIDAVVYPIELEAKVTWSVLDDSVIRIEETKDNSVNVYGVGQGTTKLIAECSGIKAEMTVYV